MEAVAGFLRITLPNYLQRLPVPNEIAGFAKLSGEQWLQLIPVVVVYVLLMYAVIQCVTPRSRPKGHINERIDKDKTKIATSHDIEDLGDKAVYCRCWKSKKFPFCDGSHNRHNSQTGDNVGPLIIKKRDVK